MAKKGQTTKKKKTEEANDTAVLNPIYNTDTSTPKLSEEDFKELKATSFKEQDKRKLIECESIDTLMNYERACAVVCKKYETMARLDGGSNSMFKKFSAYYTEILAELEKRVEVACKLPKSE